MEKQDVINVSEYYCIGQSIAEVENCSCNRKSSMGTGTRYSGTEKKRIGPYESGIRKGRERR
jgi:hypothetical protein